MSFDTKHKIINFSTHRGIVAVNNARVHVALMDCVAKSEIVMDTLSNCAFSLGDKLSVLNWNTIRVINP